MAASFLLLVPTLRGGRRSAQRRLSLLTPSRRDWEAYPAAEARRHCSSYPPTAAVLCGSQVLLFARPLWVLGAHMRFKIFVALSFIFLSDFIYCVTGGNDQGIELPSTPRTPPAQEPRLAFDPYQFSGHYRILHSWECAVLPFGRSAIGYNQSTNRADGA
jgi:hypothetical protein